MKLLNIIAAITFTLPTIAFAQSAAPQVYRDGSVWLFDEVVEIYGNRWSGEFYGRSAEGVSVNVTAEGKTVGFSGEYIVDCSSDRGFWVRATNFGSALTEVEISQTVPLEVVINARSAFCELPLVQGYFEGASSDERRDFQIRLKQYGRYDGSIDGAWGAGTASGVLKVLAYYRIVGIGSPLMTIADARQFAREVIAEGIVAD
jgi:hypothetical protein